METRKQMEEKLQSMGVCGAAADLVLKATARERHAARVVAAREAALDYACAAWRTEWSSVGYADAVAATVALLDAFGVGGPCGIGGLATDRHPAFRHCGSGRKHAADGGAWTAAIGRLIGRITSVKAEIDEDGDLAVLVSATDENGDEEFLVVCACRTDKRTMASDGSLALALDGESRQWWQSVAGRALYALVKQDATEYGLRLLDGAGKHVGFHGPAAAWAAVYNAAQAATDAALVEAPANETIAA